MSSRRDGSYFGLHRKGLSGKGWSADQTNCPVAEGQFALPISVPAEQNQQRRWHQDCGMIQFRGRLFNGPLSRY